MLSTIWVSPDWAEFLFLCAAIVFVAAATGAALARDLGWTLGNLGLALLAFGLLAL
jgi:hypothetical protein